MKTNTVCLMYRQNKQFYSSCQYNVNLDSLKSNKMRWDEDTCCIVIFKDLDVHRLATKHFIYRWRRSNTAAILPGRRHPAQITLKAKHSAEGDEEKPKHNRKCPAEITYQKAQQEKHYISGTMFCMEWRNAHPHPHPWCKVETAMVWSCFWTWTAYGTMNYDNLTAVTVQTLTQPNNPILMNWNGFVEINDLKSFVVIVHA